MKDRDGEWTNHQVMTNEKKFSRFLLEIEYTASTDYPEFFDDPKKGLWILKIITDHCPTCGQHLQKGKKTVKLVVKADKEYPEIIKILKKYFKGTYDSFEDYPRHLRDFELRKSEGSDVRSLKIFSKHYHYDCNHVTMEFENKKELEDFLNFLESELNEAESIEKEEYPRIKKWHDDNQKWQKEYFEKKKRSQKA